MYLRLSLLFCVVLLCFGEEFPTSIHTNNTPSFNLQWWNIHMQQCLHQNVESCDIIIKNGLKTHEECHAKKECAIIGEIYWNANSFKESLPFFTKACENNEMQGCYYLGLDSEKSKDFIKAKSFYQKGCAKKNMQACFGLGNLYNYGNGVRQDYEMASMLYKKACKAKNAQACFNIAILYNEGKALVHDLSLAKEFYGKACDLGLQKGCDEYRTLNQAGIPSLYSNKNIF